MRRILLACAASLVLYMTAFAWLLDRPLTLGALRARIEANLDVGQLISQPKLVILAGSNGPYSHRCETIEPLIGRPCVNAGVAVGIGLDYLFTRWKPWLHAGDIVYLPLEEAHPVETLPWVHTLCLRVVSEPVGHYGSGRICRQGDKYGGGQRLLLPLSTDGISSDGIIGATQYDLTGMNPDLPIEPVSDNALWLSLKSL